MQRALTTGVAVGNATVRAIWLKPRDECTYFFDDTKWGTGFIGKDYQWLKDGGMGGRNLDARTLFFYSATVNTPAMAPEIPGVGSNYAFATKDESSVFLDDSKRYKVNIPADAVAKDFCSFVVHDLQARSELQISGGTDYPGKNNKRDKLVYKEDDSVDLYFVPIAPESALSANWTETVSSEAWFALLRLYGPLQPWFDQTWKPSDLEQIDCCVN